MFCVRNQEQSNVGCGFRLLLLLLLSSQSEYFIYISVIYYAPLKWSELGLSGIRVQTYQMTTIPSFHFPFDEKMSNYLCDKTKQNRFSISRRSVISLLSSTFSRHDTTGNFSQFPSLYRRINIKQKLFFTIWQP